MTRTAFYSGEPKLRVIHIRTTITAINALIDSIITSIFLYFFNESSTFSAVSYFGLI